MAKAVTCFTRGNVVYVRDERGNTIDTLSFQYPVQAQSFGNGLTVTSGTMCYTFVLDGDHLKQDGMYAV